MEVDQLYDSWVRYRLHMVVEEVLQLGKVEVLEGIYSHEMFALLVSQLLQHVGLAAPC